MVGPLSVVSFRCSKCYHPAGIDLRGPGSTLQAISVLAAIVTIHELGHFIAARSQNIHVTKFSIGFGPVLFKYQVHNLHAAVHMLMCLQVAQLSCIPYVSVYNHSCAAVLASHAFNFRVCFASHKWILRIQLLVWHLFRQHPWHQHPFTDSHSHHF